MLRKFTKIALSGVLGMMAIVLASSPTVTAEDKKEDKKKEETVPTIKEIMQKGHKGTDTYVNKIKSAAKADKWDDAKEYAKTMAVFGEALGKNKVPVDADGKSIGTAESWEKLTKKYAESTKSVVKATEDKDLPALEKAFGTIKCGECHDVHRPMKKKK